MDLNKACPKDSHPLPNIGHLVDGPLGFEMLCFGDTFIGYNQDNKDKTMFITNEEVYYYCLMLFGLKNSSTTYQRMMNKIFIKHIRRNMEAFMDDILIKSKDPYWHW